MWRARANPHAEPTRAWTVADLAREVGLSRAAFTRRFARAVADRVGYQSEFAFAKAFKRGYGVALGA
jgi:AraC-like DNA-binding protein